jgi:hypothetical protein
MFHPKGAPISELWQWFKINHRRLEGANSDDQAFKQLTNLFRRIDRNLTYDIRQEEFWELQVSADGIPELIPLVREVVDQAPKMDGWKISAFRKPKAAPVTITAFDQSLNAENLFYTLDNEKHLTLFLPGLNDDNYRHLSHCAVIIVESLIGEYPLMTQVDEIDYAELPEPAPSTIKPVTSLPQALGV